MLIRPEQPEDRAAVFAVNAAAFGTTAEAELVDRLRDEVRPLVSLVAEHDGNVVGHVMFTPVTLPEATELKLMALAPMAVVAAWQRRGVGSRLARAGIEACRRLGCAALVVLGHPGYYPRFGFVPSVRFGIRSTYDVPDDVFMVLELTPGALGGHAGCVQYHQAFEGV